MPANLVELVGLSGGFITISSVIPQILKCYRTRSTQDLSWAMFAIGYTGVLINLGYGLAIHHPAIYITSLYSLCANSVLMAMKYRYDQERVAQDPS